MSVQNSSLWEQINLSKRKKNEKERNGEDARPIRGKI
jgi:hypothetical protein